MTEKGRFFVKSGHFQGTKIKFEWPYLEVVETIPGHNSSKVASGKWLSKDILLFPARLSCLAESEAKTEGIHQSEGENATTEDDYERRERCRVATISSMFAFREIQMQDVPPEESHEN